VAVQALESSHDHENSCSIQSAVLLDSHASVGEKQALCLGRGSDSTIWCPAFHNAKGWLLIKEHAKSGGIGLCNCKRAAGRERVVAAWAVHARYARPVQCSWKAWNGFLDRHWDPVIVTQVDWDDDG
jgi:hypothetical protein